MREVVVIAPAFCRAVATTIRVKKLRGTPEKLLLLMLLQHNFAHQLLHLSRLKITGRCYFPPVKPRMP
jgi:hypothetical protein